jgi:hypothetical protein
MCYGLRKQEFCSAQAKLKKKWFLLQRRRPSKCHDRRFDPSLRLSGLCVKSPSTIADIDTILSSGEEGFGHRRIIIRTYFHN